jgi:signal transduction histidine kinase
MELSRKDGYVWLKIADNGHGLEKRSTMQKPSLGMIGMKARARQAGGDISVESPAGGGLTIAAWIPLVSYTELHATQEISHPVSG